MKITKITPPQTRIIEKQKADWRPLLIVLVVLALLQLIGCAAQPINPDAARLQQCEELLAECAQSLIDCEATNEN